jgi:carbon-monoxide dehydrogenase large subunit
MPLTTRHVGAAMKRKEDRRFLTGQGLFTDDIALDNQAHAVVVRSPHAHARIRGIDVAGARAVPGVLLVLTAADVKGEIVRAIPSFSRTPPFDVARAPEAAHHALAAGRVRYPGEPVAFVVAENVALARDAAERIVVEYDPLEADVDIDRAVSPGAPTVWDDVPDNVSFRWERGDASAVESALARAAHVVRVAVLNNRVMPLFLEPRSAVAEFDAPTGRWTLRVGCQSAHGMRALLCHVLDVTPERLRVVVPDTGGGFGARGGVYPEYPLLLVAARRLGRPVKWTAGRTESFLSDYQARDHVLRGELGIDEAGRFTAMRVRADWRHGAYFTSRNVWVMVHYFPPTLGGPYRIPLAHVSLRGVFSNTTPLAAYRGIGRIEANYLTESLVEAAARVTGIDRIELRRRNLVGPTILPWTTPGGAVLTSGAFEESMTRALELSDWRGFPERRQASQAAASLRGIGLAMYVENDGSTPTEFAEVEATASGRAVVRVGTQDFGMSHDTVFSQIAADALGVPFDVVDVVFGDTDQVPRGAGSHGSRSARMGGGAVVGATRKLIEAGRELAATLLEAGPADITYDAGRFTVVGTDPAWGCSRSRRLCRGAASVSRQRRTSSPRETRTPVAVTSARSRSIPRTAGSPSSAT